MALGAPARPLFLGAVSRAVTPPPQRPRTTGIRSQPEPYRVMGGDGATSTNHLAMGKDEMRFGFVTYVRDDGRIEIPEAFRVLENIKDGLYDLRVEGDNIVLVRLADNAPAVGEGGPPPGRE